MDARPLGQGALSVAAEIAAEEAAADVVAAKKKAAEFAAALAAGAGRCASLTLALLTHGILKGVSGCRIVKTMN